MKRYGNLFEKIVNINNIRLAHKNARKGKTDYTEVKMVDIDIDKYCYEIQRLLTTKEFTTAEYEMFVKKDKGKLREIYKLPYFPDRIVQHAIMQIVEPIWKGSLIADTYQSIKGRGVHKVLPKVVKAIQIDKVKYCLKMDVKKFYPSIDKGIMKSIIRKKIKCKDTLWLLDDIVDSNCNGLPIGNYISQYLGNLYLSEIDHKLKEVLKVKYYYRYCDDIIVLCNSKEELHNIRKFVEKELNKLLLTLKRDYNVHPVYTGVDVLGYIVTSSKVSVRKNIKSRMIANYSDNSAASYNGWLTHCNGYILKLKLEKDNR